MIENPGDLFGSTRILVLGDAILDRYLYGEVRRISPEAPIPILTVTSEKITPGGAGNVIANLRGLGCNAFLCGVTGKDQAARDLEALIEGMGAHSHLTGFEDLVTTQKTRAVSSKQQILRLDHEKNGFLSPEREAKILDPLDGLLAAVQGIVLSDYGKGVCTPRICREVIGKARQKNLPVVVDPKGTDWERYRGATVVTPNLRELSDVCGRSLPNTDEAAAEAGESIRSRYGLDSLLVTRSELGMTLVQPGGTLHRRALAREVFDVSGAGDTVVAVLTACLGSGLDLAESIDWANLAAGFVVGKSGTYPIHLEELRALQGENLVLNTPGKIVSRLAAEALVREWQANGRTVVFTNGCFDILHPGHVALLEQARGLGDCLVVGLNSDNSVRRLKGPQRPVNDEAGRALMLASLASVDLVTVFDEDTPEALLKGLLPDILVKGGDYSSEDVKGREFARDVRILPLVGNFSTTSLIERLRNS